MHQYWGMYVKISSVIADGNTTYADLIRTLFTGISHYQNYADIVRIGGRYYTRSYKSSQIVEFFQMVQTSNGVIARDISYSPSTSPATVKLHVTSITVTGTTITDESSTKPDSGQDMILLRMVMS